MIKSRTEEQSQLSAGTSSAGSSSAGAPLTRPGVMLLTFLMMVFFFFFVIYVKYSMFFHNILMFMCSLNSDRLL